jgi:hypothetical protein
LKKVFAEVTLSIMNSSKEHPRKLKSSLMELKTNVTLRKNANGNKMKMFVRRLKNEGKSSLLIKMARKKVTSREKVLKEKMTLRTKVKTHEF